MSKYIDIHKLKIPKGTVTDVKLRGVPAIIELLEKQPIVDAVEIVRCKDCKYKHSYFTICCLLDGLEAIDLDSFCSKGVRRETE